MKKLGCLSGKINGHDYSLGPIVVKIYKWDNMEFIRKTAARKDGEYWVDEIPMDTRLLVIAIHPTNPNDSMAAVYPHFAQPYFKDRINNG